jgi:hypothetical protein
MTATNCAANEPSGGGGEVIKGWRILSPKMMKPTPRRNRLIKIAIFI